MDPTKLLTSVCEEHAERVNGLSPLKQRAEAPALPLPHIAVPFDSSQRPPFQKDFLPPPKTGL